MKIETAEPKKEKAVNLPGFPENGGCINYEMGYKMSGSCKISFGMFRMKTQGNEPEKTKI